MTTPSIKPLRKKLGNNRPYVRFANIEAKLAEILALSRDEILGRCVVRDKKNPAYLPSECLTYLVRSYRNSEPDTYFETIYKTLVERVMSALPPKEVTDLTQSNIRDETFERFVELLAKDRLDYVERLDFFEIRFESALARMRTDVERKAYTEKKHRTELEADQETGKFAEEVERAARDFNPFETEKIDCPDYRLRLDNAIDSLPALQKAIVEMIRKGIQIDSEDPEAVTIAKTLGKVEKTIRTHRDKAFHSIRVALTEGETP